MSGMTDGQQLRNLWALGLSRVAWPVPRGRRAFYGYYVGHLACLGLVALILPP